MLRSPFRGKLAEDSGTKDGKEDKTSFGNFHVAFHRKSGSHVVHEDKIHSHENLNTPSTEKGAKSYTNGDELYLDCNEEFPIVTRSKVVDEDEPKSRSESLSREKRAKDQHTDNFPISERQIYEMQLSQLQEQLVNTMIDYQEACDQLKKLKSIDVHKLQKELQEEKEKNSDLKEKLKRKQKAQSSKLQRKNASRIPLNNPQNVMLDQNSGDDWVDLASDEGLASLRDTEDIMMAGSSSPSQEEYTYDEVDHGGHRRRIHANNGGRPEQQAMCSQDKQPHRFQRVRAKVQLWKTTIIDLIVDRLWDFVNDEPENSDEEDDEGEPLAVKKLKENITRFKNGIKPITGFVQSIHGVLSWSNPTASFLIFLVYMYSVWHGFLLSLILFVLIWKLFMNYLHAKGLAKRLGFVEEEKTETNSSDDQSWSDKFQLVLQVARKVQNTLGKMADSLEKLKNLLMWQHSVASRKLFSSLLMALLASLLLTGRTLFLLTGLFLGIKLFIVNPIQHRFPKVKKRYDTTEKLWRELPTDADLAARKTETASNQEAPPRASTVTCSPSSPSDGHSSEQSQSPSINPILEKFKLPSSEPLVQGWEDGVRCIMFDKDKTFSPVIKHGRLFLTQSHLCYEKAKSSFGKHIVIPLDKITSIVKAKPIPIMPGTGMAIEVCVSGVDKPYIFGGIIGRGEVYESIRSTGLAANHPWARA